MILLIQRSIGDLQFVLLKLRNSTRSKIHTQNHKSKDLIHQSIMKISNNQFWLLFTLTLSVFKSTTVVLVHGFDDLDGDEEDCPSHEEEEEDEEEEARFVEEVEKQRAALVWPEVCNDQIEKCDIRVEDAIAIAEHEVDMLLERLDKTIAVADEAMAKTDGLKKEINIKKAAIESSRAQISKAQLDKIQTDKSLDVANQAFEDCNSSSVRKIQELEAKINQAKIRHQKYEQSRLLLNVDRIKSDITSFLKKHGIVKSEL